MRSILFTILLLGCISGFSQDVEENIKFHIYYLSADSLEGRLTGSKGEQMAYEYISSEYQKAGLEPYFGEEGFLHEFEFNWGKNYGPNNGLTIDKDIISLGSGFNVLPNSPEAQVKGSLIRVGSGLVVEGKRDDYEGVGSVKGKIVLMDYHFEEFDNPHSDNALAGGLKDRVELAAEKGATAVILYASNSEFDNPDLDLSRNVREWDIPIVFVDPFNPALLEEKDNKASIKVDWTYKKGHGNNVVGKIDNGAKYEIVIGAHYDHLGWGKSGGSLYRGDSAIHNGADDNASGVALMIELARELSKSASKNFNYTFIAFSGEELGLYGSKNWVKRQGFNSEDINFMINMDMVGRLDSSTFDLSISGTGTSPDFDSTLQELAPDPINPILSSSGTGPSDHMSFYLEDIPVLHFFTGTHEDYHKPSDDAEKINYSGSKLVYDYVLAVVMELAEKEKLEFTPTKDEDEGKKVARFTVTLGVVPDYMYQEEGMRIDGVTAGKPGEAAGMEKGDIVIGFDDFKVGDIYDYMEGLAKYKPGDDCKLKVLREGEEIVLDVHFGE